MTEREVIEVLYKNYEGLREVIPHALDECSTLRELVDEADRIEAEFGLGDTLVLFVVRELSEVLEDVEDKDKAAAVVDAMATARNEIYGIEEAFDNIVDKEL